MSYTAPQYVDTKEQAILALASTIKGEAVTGGDGSVNRALDILADVLAEQDVQVPQTDAGAILALADYVSGGGGGGSSDLSIAQVTITYEHEETGSDGGILLPTADEAAPPFRLEASARVSKVEFTTDKPLPVILYKGRCVTTYFGTGTVTTSGNVTYQYHEFTITGDCTITIS